MDRNTIPKEFRTEKCLENLYTAPNSSNILRDIENRAKERQRIKNISQ